MKQPLGSLALPRLCIATVCCLILLASVPAHADGIPAFSFTTSDFRTDDMGTAELGYTFSVGSNPITVGALGYINDGFNGTHTVAIFDVATQQLVTGASATVTTVGGGEASNTFTYTDLIAPVILAANTQYQIVSQFFAGEHYFTQAQNLISQPGVTFGDAVYGFYVAPPAIPQFATGTYPPNNPGDFGPNFTILSSNSSPVPEPSSIYLIVSGLLGAGVTLRRRLS